MELLIREGDLRDIARRAAGRVLAERGLLEHGQAHPAQPTLGGVNVAVDVSDSTARQSAGRELVTEQCLAKTAAGGTYVVADNAIVTPLAEEEAHRRGIHLARAGHRTRVRVAIGADHGGFALKKDVIAWVGELGHQAHDFGTRDENPVDYPDFARAVGEAVSAGQCELGIVIDGAGIGSAIAANKVPGVRAATCCDVAMAKNAREHNYANVLSIGARMISRATAHDIVRTFLATGHGEARHGKRVEKITDIERRYMRGDGARA